jgi:hypothetical protein
MRLPAALDPPLLAALEPPDVPTMPLVPPEKEEPPWSLPTPCPADPPLFPPPAAASAAAFELPELQPAVPRQSKAKPTPATCANGERRIPAAVVERQLDRRACMLPSPRRKIGFENPTRRKELAMGPLALTGVKHQGNQTEQQPSPR